MNRLLSKLIVFVVLVMFLVAPHSAMIAQTATPCSPTVATGPGSDEDVRVQVILDKIRGHLLVALPLWQSGDYDMAVMHASHPTGELLTLIVRNLRGACLLGDMTKALSDNVELMSRAGDKAAAAQANMAVLKLLDQASVSLIPPTAHNDPVFNFRVVAGILFDSRQEYSEGYKDGKITLPIEYQDSMGFYLAAKARYDSIKDGLMKVAPDAVKAAEPFWKTLAQAYPSVQPPDKPVDPKALSGTVDGITGDIAKALSISLEAKLTPLEYLNNANESLMEAQALYEKGSLDDAYEEAASAYLDQFENVEGPLAAKDKELMETIETQMKAYRDAIKAGKPAAEVKAMLTQVMQNIEKAIALLN